MRWDQVKWEKVERVGTRLLKGIEEENEDSKDEDEYENEDEDLTFITNEIIKLLQYRKKDKNKAPRKFESFTKGKNEKPLIQCHECKDFGYMKIECLNYLMKEKTKNSKGKVLVATLSDSESDFLMSMRMNVVII